MYSPASPHCCCNAVSTGEVKPAQTIETEDQASLTSQDDQLGTANYHTVLTQEAWDQLWQRMQNADHFAIDTETTSLDYRIAEMVGFSIAFDAKDAYYVPLAHNYEMVSLNHATVIPVLN
ncbi:hypothetical protein [Klebsiella pneumoniae]